VDLVALAGPAADPEGIAIGDDGQLFWADEDRAAIFTSNLDGTAARTLVDLEVALGSGTYQPEGVATDGEWVYWTDEFQDGVYRATISGALVSLIVDFDSTFGGTSGVADYFSLGLATDRDFLYWTSRATGVIYRAAPDGSGATAIAASHLGVCAAEGNIRRFC